MTDKTPKKTAETPVNNTVTYARKTDTARDSEPKSRVLPQVDALKARFKAGSIPLQTDFADLIDLANMGRQAVGGGEGQTGPADGFTLSSTGRLELKPNAASGSGLNLTSNGLSVDPGNGIQINQQGVSLKLAPNSGLSADETNGLKIVPEQMFQKGMVMMFAGTAAEMPTGWALCDGDQGRPNLIDRFILGGGLGDVNIKNDKTLSGSINDKEYTSTSDSQVVNVTGETDEIELSLDQMPKHEHDIGIRMEKDGYPGLYESATYGGNADVVETEQDMDGYRRGDTESVGGGKGHSHGINIKTVTHSHKVNTMPPYYILAFIIKL